MMQSADDDVGGKGERTKALILATAEELFASRGYTATSTKQVADEAGLTRGAVYFHFSDKKDLFRAVFEQLELRLMERLAAGALGSTSAWDVLVAGCRVYLDACLEESFSRTVLLDAPSVLGWDEWRELEDQYALGAMKSTIEACIAEGSVHKRPVSPMAQMLLACLTEAGMLIARSNRKRKLRKEMGGAVAVFLEGMAVARGVGSDI